LETTTIPNPFDLVVIGGGPAGASGALGAALFGKRVALVEREPRLGGAGINTGTVPSKALRESALVISGWRARKLLGVEFNLRRDVSLRDFTHHEARVRDTIAAQWEQRADALGVVRMRGRAAFDGPHAVRVTDGERAGPTVVRGEYFLIASGSAPLRPAEFPFQHPRVHDSNEILEMGDLPKRLAVVGAGVVGAEYAGTFAALGVEVHVIDGRDRLLGFLDQEVSQAIAAAMQRMGVQFHWNEKVVSCRAPREGDIVLEFESGRELAVTDVLVAAGRSSNTTDLNLSAAGLVPGRRGLIEVNAFGQSAVPHIYAAGDVTGPPALAGTGMEQARVAVCHAFGFLEKSMPPLLPTGIYTIPEASMGGLTEQAARDAGEDVIVGRAPYDRNARGQLIGDESGFLKLVFRRADMRLLGVHAVGEQATELVHVGLIALMCGGDAELFNRACFNYPTLGDLYKYATYDAMLQRAGVQLDVRERSEARLRSAS
jgi:NAD(P) transhydrogenase